MPINVTCPSCLKRFAVSDKFAGKSGPCPNCEKTIKIPEKTDEVVIHAPPTSGPKDASGKAILKPIRRRDVKIGMPVIVGGILATAAIFAIATGLGLSGQQPPTSLLVSSALVLAFPITFVGYWFLHDDELEGYNGRQLIIRCSICALIFTALWGIYALLPKYVSGYAAMQEYSALDMAVYLPLMVILGTIVAVAALELEVVQGAMHYLLYLSLTLILAWLAGTQLAEPLSNGSSVEPAAAPIGSPEPAAPTEPSDEGKKAIPDLLQ